MLTKHSRSFFHLGFHSPEELELVPPEVGLLRAKGCRKTWRSSRGRGGGGGRDRGSGCGGGGGGGEAEAEAAGSGGGVRPGKRVIRENEECYKILKREIQVALIHAT